MLVFIAESVDVYIHGKSEPYYDEERYLIYVWGRIGDEARTYILFCMTPEIDELYIEMRDQIYFYKGTTVTYAYLSKQFLEVELLSAENRLAQKYGTHFRITMPNPLVEVEENPVPFDDVVTACRHIFRDKLRVVENTH